MDYLAPNPVTRLKIKILFIVLVSLLSACTLGGSPPVLPYFEGPDLTPVWRSPLNSDPTGLRQIGNFLLTDQDGKPVGRKDFQGKIIVANFFFATCPSICPVTMSQMKKIEESVHGNLQVLLISHTVNPEQDTPAVLKKFAEDRNLPTEQWHLLTGDRKELYTLARTSYFADQDLGQEKLEEEFLHSENFYLLDTQGYIRGIYNGTQGGDVRKLLEDVQTLGRQQTL